MSDIIKIETIQFKRGKRATLIQKLKGKNRLKEGEPAFEIPDDATSASTLDVAKLKIGDGIHNYKDLPYVSVSKQELNEKLAQFNNLYDSHMSNIEASFDLLDTKVNNFETRVQTVITHDIPESISDWFSSHFKFVTIEQYNDPDFEIDPDTFYFISEGE